MVKVSVPNFFRCPISLEMMRDPVTLTTGQTYDRSSIEKWFETGHETCPSTMQVLSCKDLAPNHTLRRLIHDWRASNSYYGVSELPSLTKSATNPRQVAQMLQELVSGTDCCRILKQLRSVAKELNGNRKLISDTGAIPVVANFVFSTGNTGKGLETCEEALGILTLLPLQDVRKCVHIGHEQLLAISRLLCRGSLEGRVNAAQFLASLAGDDKEMKRSVGATPDVFDGMVLLLKDHLYKRASETSLKALVAIISDGPKKNIHKAVKAGLGFALVEVLAQADHQRRCKERALTLLEILCSCAKGRAAVGAHALLVPVLARIISLQISCFATESAVSCMWTICQCGPRRCLDEASGQAGFLTQLSHLIEVGSISHQCSQRASRLLKQLRDRLKNCNHRL